MDYILTIYRGVVILYVIQSNDASNKIPCSFRNWEKVLCPTLSMDMVGQKAPIGIPQISLFYTQYSDQS